MTPMERFESNVIPEPNSGCWLWNGTCRGECGYGVFMLDAAYIGAHRASWILHQGDIPAKMLVCHKCDVRACVNPDHLFLGTHQDNMDDMKRKRRFFYATNPKEARAFGVIGGSQNTWSSGVNSNTAKLTALQAQYIILCEDGSKKIAKRFGLHHSSILKLRMGAIYKNETKEARTFKAKLAADMRAALRAEADRIWALENLSASRVKA